MSSVNPYGWYSPYLWTRIAIVRFGESAAQHILGVKRFLLLTMQGFLLCGAWRMVHFSARSTWRLRGGNLRANLPFAFGVDARCVSGAMSLHRPARWFDWAGERFSAHSFGDDRLPLRTVAVVRVGAAGPSADSPAGRFTLHSDYGGVHERPQPKSPDGRGPIQHSQNG
jgi:hypothetical protein